MTFPIFSPGDPVRIMKGLSAGLRGEIVTRAHNFGDVPAYRVRITGTQGAILRDRIIRCDFIEREESQPS